VWSEAGLEGYESATGLSQHHVCQRADQVSASACAARAARLWPPACARDSARFICRRCSMFLAVTSAILDSGSECPTQMLRAPRAPWH
jgi:hypothetical protein